MGYSFWHFGSSADRLKHSIGNVTSVWILLALFVNEKRLRWITKIVGSFHKSNFLTHCTRFPHASHSHSLSADNTSSRK